MKKRTELTNLKPGQVNAICRELRSEANKYIKAKPFIDELKKCHKALPYQQYSTLRGQALSGDVEGAYKGLRRALGV